MEFMHSGPAQVGVFLLATQDKAARILRGKAL